MYFVFGIEVLGGLAVLDAIDFAVGRTGGVDVVVRINGDGEDFGTVGGPDQRGCAVGGDAKTRPRWPVAA